MEEYAMQLDFSAGQWSKTHFHPFKKILCWKKIKLLDWPSQSLDLNPTEHLWDELDWRVRCRSYSNKDQFFAALLEEWSQFPFKRLQNLVYSMPNRCVAVIKARGYATKYWFFSQSPGYFRFIITYLAYKLVLIQKNFQLFFTQDNSV